MSKNLGDRCCYFVATGFCFGLAPFMPGTFAALAGLLLHLAVIGWLPQAAHWPVTFALFLLFSVLCLAMNDWAERRWNVCDHHNFVLDEIAGYLFVPVLYRAQENWRTALIGFVLFRVLDIVKVFPANIVDKRMKNRWGVLLDDLVSASYAAGLMYLVL